jgi:hypothetical protein
MVLLLIIGWVVLLAAWVLSFDRIIWLQYTRFRRSWEKDGKPYGTFWVPPEVRRSGGREFVRSWLSEGRVGWDWLFITPAWAGESTEVRVWLIAYRLLTLINIFMPVGAVLFLEYVV